MTKGQDCCDRVFGTGGGATEFRFSNVDFANFNSLKSRIMVAAGGGGRFSDGSGSDYRSQDGESSDGEGYRWTDKEEEQIGMPSHSDNSIIMGNSGNGYARITLVSID